MIYQNAFLIYFLKKLTTPFIDTDAYALDLIDERGKILKKIKDLKTTEEREALTRLDVLIFNLKRIIEKFPLGKTRLGSIAAALFLLRESKGILTSQLENNQIFLQECVLDYFERIDYVRLTEMAANVSGSGAIAGVNDDLKLKKQILNTPEDDEDEEEMDDIEYFFRRKVEKAIFNGKRILLNKPFKNLQEKYSVYVRSNDSIVKINL